MLSTKMACSEDNLILVTGASGFCASHIILQLLQQSVEKNYHVRGTVRNLANENKVKFLKNLCPNAEDRLTLVEADLRQKECWKKAVEGCRYVIHVASPIPSDKTPRTDDYFVKPAMEGTKALLVACAQSLSVKRVVLTSSIASIAGSLCDTVGHGRVFTEADWTDLSKEGPYEKSKTLTERWAWEYVEKLAEDSYRFELAVINPGFVIGPQLGGMVSPSVSFAQKILTGKFPGIPNISFPSVDVRDVAAAHIAAMTLPEAAGHRHILVADNFCIKEMAQLLHREFHSQGYKISLKQLPDWIIRVFAIFNKNAKATRPYLSKVIHLDNSRMRNVLGIEPKDVRKALIDMAYSVVECGYVPKTSKYKGPGQHISAEI